MTKNKKKDAPGGTPIPKQDYRTIPKSKNQYLAELMLDKIGDRDHPLKRPPSPGIDRELRGLIAERNADGSDIIINLGEGYFRPGAEDRSVFYQYILAEKSRAREIIRKVDTMLDTYEEQYGRCE